MEGGQKAIVAPEICETTAESEGHQSQHPTVAKTLTPSQILQSICSKHIPKEEKDNPNRKMKHKNFIDEKRIIIFKTYKIGVDNFRNSFHWASFIGVDFTTQCKPVTFEEDENKCESRVFYFRTKIPIWMEHPKTKDWKALLCSCFCYWSSDHEKCGKHFLQYMFQAQSFDEVLEIFQWNKSEWDTEDYKKRRDIYLKVHRSASPFESDATWRSENHARVSTGCAQLGMRRAFVSYCNSQKLAKVGMTEMEETPLTKSLMKKFGVKKRKKTKF